jgi:DNA polymerase-3 subunit epsilon
LKILGKDSIQNHVIDTLVLAKNKFPGSPVSLDALCRRYRIDNSKREKHTALIDCDLLSKVYINLIDQKEPKLNFQTKDQKDSKDTKEKILYFKKIIKPSSQEIEKHNQYLKNSLKKNFFN